MKPKYELMAPAGDITMFTAAVKAGADAVYFGLNDFSMRAASKNVAIADLDEMRELSIETGFAKNAEGSVIVTLGKTKVIGGLKMLVGEPYPDSQDEGSIAIGAETLPLGNINKQTVKMIFNGKPAKQLRSDLKIGHAFVKNKECRNCSSFESYKNFKPGWHS